jgi:hypothetical protein
VSGKLPVRRLVRVKANEDVTLARPLNSLLVKHLHEPRRGQGKRRERDSALPRKPSNRSPNPKIFLPGCATILDSPGILSISARNPDSRSPNSRSRTPDLLSTTTSQALKWSKANSISWVTLLSQNHSPLPLVISNLGTRFFLRGVDCDAPGF